jgi:SAM-dependent methyltransferase
VDTLAEKPELSDSIWKQDEAGGKVRKRALVPGCGRGYDVLLFASYGYDAYGLDASSTALRAAEKLLQDQGKEQHFPMQHIQNGRGEVKFVEADFFSDSFLPSADLAEAGGPFDLIYDYTFLCALPPSLRPRWAARMSELLASDGVLICLE